MKTDEPKGSLSKKWHERMAAYLSKHQQGAPCEFDHNGECLICDCWPGDCAYVRYQAKDYSMESQEELELMFAKRPKHKITEPDLNVINLEFEMARDKSNADAEDEMESQIINKMPPIVIDTPEELKKVFGLGLSPLTQEKRITDGYYQYTSTSTTGVGSGSSKPIATSSWMADYHDKSILVHFNHPPVDPIDPVEEPKRFGPNDPCLNCGNQGKWITIDPLASACQCGFVRVMIGFNQFEAGSLQQLAKNTYEASIIKCPCCNDPIATSDPTFYDCDFDEDGYYCSVDCLHKAMEEKKANDTKPLKSD